MRRAGLFWMAAAPVLLAGRVAFADELPTCDRDRAPYKAWVKARQQATGLSARSADKYLMPTATAADDCNGTVDLSLNQSGRFDDGIHAWIAAGRCKEIVCGTAFSIEPFCGGVLATGECDLNNNILVSDADADADDSTSGARLLVRHQCLEETVGLPEYLALEGGALCFQKPPLPGWLLHAEATGPYGKARDALKAAWFSDAEYDAWKASLAEGQMCVYGPIVGDTGHGLKAEVHPVGMYWWARGTPAGTFAPGGPYDLLMVQDASGRFGNEYGYVIQEPFPENRVWRPWSQAPSAGQFEIPVWVRDQDVLAGACPPEKKDESAPQAPAAMAVGTPPPAPPAPAFRIEPWRACQDAPTITQPDDPPHRQCVSKASPQLYVEVAAKNTSSEKFDVSADWACRCEPPLCGEKGYLGYLRVDGRVGLDRDFWEGALGLTVIDTRRQPAVDLPRCSSQAAASRAVRQSAARTSGTLAGRVRRILTKRNGKDAEKLGAPLPPTAALLKTLLDAVAWPDTLRKPPVEEIRRPKEIELEVATRVTGLEEEAIKHLEIAKAWKVEAEPLSPGSVPTALVDKTADKVKVRLPDTAGPWKIHATVDLKPNDPNVPAPPPLSQVLWSDRLALKGSEIESWIDEMTAEVVQACDESVRSRAMGERERQTTRRRLPATVRNMLAETSRRREVTMTTLAILAYLETSGCPEPKARSAGKLLMR